MAVAQPGQPAPEGSSCGPAVAAFVRCATLPAGGCGGGGLRAAGPHSTHVGPSSCPFCGGQRRVCSPVSPPRAVLGMVVSPSLPAGCTPNQLAMSAGRCGSPETGACTLPSPVCPMAERVLLGRSSPLRKPTGRASEAAYRGRGLEVFFGDGHRKKESRNRFSC